MANQVVPTRRSLLLSASAAREVFVINSGNDTVSVFDTSLSGNVNALRQFGIITGLSAPLGIAVDTVNNEIFVVNKGNSSITVYGRTASGNIMPVRTISGASTGLSAPLGIAVDMVNNEIFVANTGMTDHGIREDRQREYRAGNGPFQAQTRACTPQTTLPWTR